MRVDSGVVVDAITGTAKARPTADDSSPIIEPIVSLVSPSQCRNVVGIPTGAINPEVSVIASAGGIQAAAQPTVVTTMVSVPPGKYTIDGFVTARFTGAPAAGVGNPDVRIDIINTQLTTGAMIVGVLGVDATAQHHGRRVNVILTESHLVRRIVQATGAGQTIEFQAMVSVERHL